jgi:hypothetical protein
MPSAWNSPTSTHHRFGASAIARSLNRASDGRSTSGWPRQPQLRPGEWYARYGTAQAARSKSVEPQMMVPGAGGARDHGEAEAEMEKLMTALEHEVARAQRLRADIRECKGILQQARVQRGRAQRRESGSTQFESLTFCRARGIQRAKMSMLWPHVKNPASYDLGAL